MNVQDQRSQGTRVKRTVGASVVDLFCGAGGLSYGFKLEGFPIVAGIDVDESCRYPYETNNEATFIRKDVADIKPQEIERLFTPDLVRVMVGCAPCQPFSSYNQKNDDPKWRLLRSFGDLIEGVLPDVVSMENVPSLLKFKCGRTFKEFLKVLTRSGYHVAWGVLYGPDFGLAQTRSRLVLLASRLGEISLPKATHRREYRTVADEIGHLPPLKHGEADITDALHCTSKLSALNARR